LNTQTDAANADNSLQQQAFLWRAVAENIAITGIMRPASSCRLLVQEGTHWLDPACHDVRCMSLAVRADGAAEAFDHFPNVYFLQDRLFGIMPHPVPERLVSDQ
jgi:hypothetical protein